MSLSIVKLKLPKKNYDYIILRKNYRFMQVLGIFYHSTLVVGYRNVKLIILDMPQISFWVYVHKVLFPKWLLFWIKPLTHLSYLNYDSCSLVSHNMVQNSFIPRTSLGDLMNLRKNKIRAFYFYKGNAILRSWLSYKTKKKLKTKTNVTLYKKKI